MNRSALYLFSSKTKYQSRYVRKTITIIGYLLICCRLQRTINEILVYRLYNRVSPYHIIPLPMVIFYFVVSNLFIVDIGDICAIRGCLDSF